MPVPAVPDVDAIIGLLRRGRPVPRPLDQAWVPLVAALTGLYARGPVRAIADPAAVDRTVATWAAAWCQIELGLFPGGSGAVHPTDAADGRDPAHAALVEQVSALLDDDRNGVEARSFATYVLAAERGEPSLIESIRPTPPDAGSEPVTIQPGERPSGLLRRIAQAHPGQLADRLRPHLPSPAVVLIDWFGYPGIWQDERSWAVAVAVDRAMVPNGSDRSIPSAPEAVPLVRFTKSVEDYLREVLTALGRRRLAGFGEFDNRLSAQSVTRDVLLYRVAYLYRAWARTDGLRAAADVVLRLTRPLVDLMTPIDRRIPDPAADIAVSSAHLRESRRRYLVRLPIVVVAAVAAGWVAQVVPAVVAGVVFPIVLGGAIHLVRRWAGFRDWLAWSVCVAVGLVIGAGHIAGQAIERPPSVGWGLAAAAITAAVSTIALRSPWTRASVPGPSAFVPDNALPADVADVIDNGLPR